MLSVMNRTIYAIYALVILILSFIHDDDFLCIALSSIIFRVILHKSHLFSLSPASSSTSSFHIYFLLPSHSNANANWAGENFSLAISFILSCVQRWCAAINCHSTVPHTQLYNQLVCGVKTEWRCHSWESRQRAATAAWEGKWRITTMMRLENFTL